MKYSNINWDNCYKIVLKLQRKIIVAYLSGNYKRVRNLQETLVSTFEARALAVRKITSNEDKDIAGVDNKVIKSDREKFALIKDLKNLNNYKAQPLKRIVLKKFKPLYIPTIFDKCVQALYLLALDPIAEIKGDSKSFGFRKYRSIQDVQRYIRQCLALENRARFILKINIKGLFGKDNQNWLINNIPLNKKILKEWLKFKLFKFYNTTFLPTSNIDKGVVIAPTLINMMLDGLEKKIEETIKNIAKIRRKEDKTRPNPKINFVRYIDYFIITAEKKEYFKIVLEDLNPFLKERGLKLNKKKIYNIKQGFNFLGFNFRKYKTTTRSNNEILLIKPTKLSFLEIRKKAKLIFKKEIDPIALITKLNPILKNWANYYKYTNAKRIFTKVDNYIFECIIRWIRKRDGSKQFIAKCKKYFTKVGNRSYVFQMTRDNKSYTLFRLETTEIKTHVMVRNLNPYLKENEDYFKDRDTKIWMSSLSPLVIKLLKRQLNICPVCDNNLNSQDEERLEIHHIQPKEFSGTNQLKNLLLLHKTCHNNVTNCNDPILIARYKSKGILDIPNDYK